MFHLTPEMLKILMVLSKDPAWAVFMQEFKKIRDENVEDALHFTPDPADMNARDRQTLLRGVAVCLDVLCNSFTDPVTLLEEIVLIEKTEALKKESNPF